MATKNIVFTQTVYEMGAKQMHYWWEHSSMKMSRIIFNGGDGGQFWNPFLHSSKEKNLSMVDVIRITLMFLDISEG